MNGLAGEQTRLEVGEASHIQAQLKKLTGIIDEEILNKKGTGIPEIKEKIFNYINTERVFILKKRCEASINTILTTSKEIYQLVSKRYPENPEEAKRFEEDRRRVLFSEWWNYRWEEKKADLQKFYDSSVANNSLDNLTGNSATSLAKFKERYLQIVASEIQKLKEEAFRKKAIIFAANSFPQFDRMKANFAWREDLYGDISKLLSSIARQLALELKDEALNLVEYMTSLLWGSKQVKERLIDKSEEYFLSKLENSSSVLFLRFARPVAEVLIRAPLNSDARDKIAKSLGVDIEIVDNYYTGEEAAFQVLKRYAKYGYKLLYNPETRQQVLGIKGIVAPIINVVTQITIDVSSELKSSQDDVTFEVENDINAFEEYLRAAIFEAAGFQSYCIQELKGLIDSFREKQGTWMGVALNEWLQENPLLLAEIPPELRSQESNLEVSDRLRQLSTALKK
ncbi:hypothetical protein [Nostoc sp.]|uniref:hypothetical protein n=1 Tax=Nostoc sp. TaxID=1180 RepID=UPI002FF7AA27